MPLESTIICLDTSEFMRNGDFTPTRHESQQDAANLVVGAKMQQNPESSVGVLTMASTGRGAGARVLVSPTDDMGNILNSLHNASVGGQLNFVEGVQVAQLALKHRRNKNGAQRIVLFVGSPVEAEQKALVKVGKLLKKNNIAVDVVVLGDRDGNADKLRAFVDAANANDNSNLVAIPAGVVPSDVLISSPVIQGKDSGGGGGGGEASTGGGGGGSGGFAEFGGIDPNLDPELAMALRISMEEERARQEAAAAEGGAAPADGAAAEASPAASTEDAPAASTPKTPEAPDNEDAMDEDDALLQEALAMSMKEDTEGATVEPAAMEEDDEEDEEMKLALAMSMQQASSEAPAPAAAGGEFNDPAFVNSMLAQLPGVDPNDPAIQAALASINQGGEKKDDDAPAPAPAP
jgi:26S proteasome regulatory subunit N10